MPRGYLALLSLLLLSPFAHARLEATQTDSTCAVPKPFITEIQTCPVPVATPIAISTDLIRALPKAFMGELRTHHGAVNVPSLNYHTSCHFSGFDLCRPQAIHGGATNLLSSNCHTSCHISCHTSCISKDLTCAVPNPFIEELQTCPVPAGYYNHIDTLRSFGNPSGPMTTPPPAAGNDTMTPKLDLFGYPTCPALRHPRNELGG